MMGSKFLEYVYVVNTYTWRYNAIITFTFKGDPKWDTAAFP